MLLGPRLGSLWSICGHWLVKPLIPFLLDPPTIVTLMDVYLWSSSCFTNYCRGSKRKPLLSDMSQNEGVDRKQDKCDSRDWDVYRTRRFRVMVLDTIQVLLVCRAWINRNFLRVKKALIRKQFSDQIRELYYNVIINVRLIFSFVSCSFAHNVTTFRHWSLRGQLKPEVDGGSCVTQGPDLSPSSYASRQPDTDPETLPLNSAVGSSCVHLTSPRCFCRYNYDIVECSAVLQIEMASSSDERQRVVPYPTSWFCYPLYSCVLPETFHINLSRRTGSFFLSP